MKWNILVASLVLSVGLSAQGFGFDLLDQMLGLNGCGCAHSCCVSKPVCGCEAVPACGCEAKPVCGCEVRCCKPKCKSCCRKPLLGCCKSRCCKPKCGCEAKPACGCEVRCCKPKCKSCCGLDILDGLFGCLHLGCKKPCGACGCEAKPVCGCEAPPACGCEVSCCKPKCGKSCCGLGLLDTIFGCLGCGCKKHCGGCGCEVSCGCGTPVESDSGADNGGVAPVPPAPVVDPSAFVPGQKKVVHASSNVVR